jgi:O-methyltransferase
LSDGAAGQTLRQEIAILENQYEPSVDDTLDQERVKKIYSLVATIDRLMAQDQGRVATIDRLMAQDQGRVATIDRLMAQDQERVATIDRLMVHDQERAATTAIEQAGKIELQTQLAEALFTSEELRRPNQVEFEALDHERVARINELEKLLVASNFSYGNFEHGDALRADGIEVRGRNLSFLHEKNLSEAWQVTKIRNVEAWRGNVPDVRWRAHIAVWAAKQALHVEGDFVECGVYAGLLSGTICSALKFASVKKRFFLFDTFDGIPESERPHAGSQRIKEINSHYIDVRKIVRQNFSEYPNVKIVEGILPGTLPKARIGKISYLSVDLNTAETERQVIESLWPKVSPGGIVLIDDYGWSACLEQYEMWNKFAKSKGLSIACLPTGQGLLIKPQLKLSKSKGKS